MVTLAARRRFPLSGTIKKKVRTAAHVSVLTIFAIYEVVVPHGEPTDSTASEPRAYRAASDWHTFELVLPRKIPDHLRSIARFAS